MYSWSFAPEEEGANPIDPMDVFDLLPIRGLLEAGANEIVELTYKGTTAAKAKAVALCSVSHAAARTLD